MERETGFEPATNSLEGCDSTPELLPRAATAANRESKIVNCFRRCALAVDSRFSIPDFVIGGQGRIRTSVARSAADLQSAAINHSATCPRPRSLEPTETKPRLPASTGPRRRPFLEPAVGLEPATFRLQIGCSTFELRRRKRPAFKEHTRPIPTARTAESTSASSGSRGFRKGSLPDGLVGRRGRRRRDVQRGELPLHGQPGQQRRSPPGRAGACPCPSPPRTSARSPVRSDAVEVRRPPDRVR